MCGVFCQQAKEASASTLRAVGIFVSLLGNKRARLWAQQWSPEMAGSCRAARGRLDPCLGGRSCRGARLGRDFENHRALLRPLVPRAIRSGNCVFPREGAFGTFPRDTGAGLPPLCFKPVNKSALRCAFDAFAVPFARLVRPYLGERSKIVHLTARAGAFEASSGAS